MNLWYGNIVDQDQDKALSVFEEVEDKNDPFYLRWMGEINRLGSENIDIDENKALDYFTKAFKRGYSVSAWDIARMYLYGTGDIKKDKEKALEWLDRGIECNQTDCMVHKATLYLSNDTAYQDMHNPRKGIELVKKATKHGSGTAFYLLGLAYADGVSVKLDDAQATSYLEKATELKNADAAYNLGCRLIKGTGCEKDVAKGIKALEKAAEYGSGAAANNLYVYYNDGSAYERHSPNKELAKEYLLRAAKLGDSYGYFNLGCHYFEGDLVEKNNDLAFKYAKKAADAGHLGACELLAYFYENGFGCTPDPKMAKEYKAKANGE